MKPGDKVYVLSRVAPYGGLIVEGIYATEEKPNELYDFITAHDKADKWSVDTFIIK